MHVKGLNRNQIKYIVIIAMVIDHIAWAFVPTLSGLGIAMHFIGRLTGPTMAFFIAEGYLHTSDIKRYAARLCIFAFISWIPFSIFENGRWPTCDFGMIYTLFLGLIAVWVWDKAKINYYFKIAIVIIILLLSSFGDWSYTAVLIPLILVNYKDDEELKWGGLILICLVKIALAMTYGWKSGLMQSGILLVPLMLIFLYNGEAGSKHHFHKWFFYVFYPLHLVILIIIRYKVLGIGVKFF